MVTGDIERAVYRCIGGEVQKLRGTMLAINGMPDHVHLVAQLPGSVAPANCMRLAKGVSSTLARNRLVPGGSFGWQDGYGGFMVSPRHLQTAIEYVQNQKRHHAEGTTIAYLEDCGPDENEPPLGE